ncbi:hypothetical protein DB347_17510 [Opitutaceae bacterium EW11]|nr:hypothetical protein DB347_17510 [Opitutaceae bacterium EW11]
MANETSMDLGYAMRAAGFGLSLFVSSLVLKAQDVTVTDPSWITPPEDQRLQIPTFRKTPSIEYPQEMKSSETGGYALVEEYVQTDGKRSTFSFQATSPYIEASVYQHRATWFRPAVLDGNPVESEIWYAIILNPKAASAQASNAKPRVLKVTPIFAAGASSDPRGSLVAKIVVEINAEGAVTDVLTDSPDAIAYRQDIQTGLKSWKFAPARRDGNPVAGQLSLPVIITPPWTAAQPGKTNPPKAIRKVRPEFPYAAQEAGYKGEVQIALVVDTQGVVREPIVVRSSNPAFDEPAVEAARQWKYEPGLRNGQPVNTALLQDFVFEFNIPHGGNDLATVDLPSAENLSKIPEQYRFDVPPKPRSIVFPVYPYELLRAKTRGHAKVVYCIDAGGKVIAARVVEASHPEFGLALVAAVSSYEFYPASKKGEPISTILTVKQVFSFSEDENILPRGDAHLLGQEIGHPDRILSPKDLDSPLTPISRRSPIFPCTVNKAVTEGRAVVEILVDRDGKARLPRIVSASEPDFGYAAVQAARDWSFEPPQAKKRNVVVRVRIPFKFSLEAL